MAESAGSGAASRSTHAVVVVEVCCDSLQSAEIAMRAGAHRIELCIALALGGVTPSNSFVAAVLAQRAALGSATQVGVLVRPREGDFVYTPAEIQVICDDISAFRKLGVDFVAVGALREDGSLHGAALDGMLRSAQGADEGAAPVEVVCHRCVDVAADYMDAVKAALHAGCCRVLTSGGADSAASGAPALRQLLGEKHIEPQHVCAASGISVDNVDTLLAAVPGLRQLHGSFRGDVQPGTAERQVLPGEQGGRRLCDAASVTAVMKACAT